MHISSISTARRLLLEFQPGVSKPSQASFGGKVTKGRTKRARLERKGWKFGSAATFLGLSRDEENRLDIETARKRLADPKEVPIPYERFRKALGLD